MKPISILKKIAFLFFFFSIQILPAQNPWKEITLYTTTGDSSKGEISIPANFKSFYGITVREKSSGILKEYKPSEIKSFVINTPQQKNYFKTFIVEADFSPTNLADLLVLPMLVMEKDTVFAQLLVRGDKELYYYKDNRVFKKHYLIRENEDMAMELINKRYYVNLARSVAVYNEEYKKQLSILLTDSSIINAKRIQSTAYIKSELKKLIVDYNKGTGGQQNSYIYEEEKMGVRFGIVAGINRASMKFEGTDDLMNEVEFNKSTGFNAGLNLELIVPKTRQRFSFYNELLYSNYNIHSKEFYSLYIHEQHYNQDQYKFKASYLKLINALRFRLPYNFCPYIQAGVANNIALTYESMIVKQHVFYSTSTLESVPLPFRKYEQSLIAGVGCEFKKIGMEVRWEHGNGMSTRQHIRSSMNYAYALLSFTF